MLKSIIIAFSTYSRIPMPHCKWNERSMKYSLCFFPLVGVVIGGLYIAILWLGAKVSASVILVSGVLTVLPLLVTGGIHMDGYMDTIDALSSYKSMEERLEIMKDPHTGAFAVIRAITYVLLYFVFMYENVKMLYGASAIKLSQTEMRKIVLCVALGFVISRILSGLAVVCFKKAKGNGMAADESRLAGASVKAILLVELVICVVGLILTSPIYGTVAAVTSLACFLYYRVISYKKFGGVTGDLAGYFLQICELMMLLAVILIILIWRLV